MAETNGHAMFPKNNLIMSLIFRDVFVQHQRNYGLMRPRWTPSAIIQRSLSEPSVLQHEG